MKARILALALAAAAMPAAAGATIFTFYTTLAGSNESPANASPGTGFATLVWDDLAHTASYDITFSGLIGTVTASHTHSPTPGQLGPNFTVATTTPTYTGFPSGVTAGAYQHVFDTTLASSYNPAYVTAFGSVSNAEAALLTGLRSGQAYLNIHTTIFPGGEIRGNWAIPEPGTWALMLGGFGAVGLMLRRRQRAIA